MYIPSGCIFFGFFFVILFHCFCFAISAQNKCYRMDGKRFLENMSWLWVYYDEKKLVRTRNGRAKTVHSVSNKRLIYVNSNENIFTSCV